MTQVNLGDGAEPMIAPAMTPVPPEAWRAETAWHARAPAEALAAFATTRHGLAEAEARARLARYGPNRLPEPPRRGMLARFLAQFHNVLIYVLLAAAAVTALLGEALDTAVILGVVLVNAAIGFFQEGKAERALEAIRHLLAPRATVLRDGRRREVGAELLVPGDVVLLASGDRVPADLRLIETHNLRIDEAALTGESLPVDKAPEAVPPETTLAERRAMAYSGTLVTYGRGLGVVVATGAATEIGRISGLLEAVEKVETPLLKRMAGFGRFLAAAIVAVSGLAFVFGVAVRDFSAADMFLAAVAIAVAAIPEGLPAIMTITLAIGVQRMARRHAIVRQLPAVETLGSVTVICTDKTGTLTRNEMTVRTLVTADASYTVSGTGYAPLGGFALEGMDVTPDERPELIEIARAALAASEASLHAQGEEWVLAGDPTEGALVALALKSGLDPRYEAEALPRTDVVPFESERRYMATLHHDHAGHGFVYLKGAPERVLELCSAERAAGSDRPIERGRWLARMDALAARGERVLALAVRLAPDGARTLRYADVERGGFTLLALAGLADPPREEAIVAVHRCRAAGVRVKMVTGDHPRTAVAIAAQLGLEARRPLTGQALAAMDAEALAGAVAQTDVFARASPEHKLRLVEALQARGEIVAMTGDGVNDAPALKRADIGVAMGRKGTEAAKEAADMVLADDNFASIAAAVEEGRAIYDNLRKAVIFVLPTNGGQAGAVLAAILAGLALPVSPVQILWVNMVTAVTLALAFAFEPAEPEAMRRPPRDPREALVSGLLVWRIAFVSLLLVAGTVGLFLWGIERGATVPEARTIAVNALVAGELVYLFNCRRLVEPVFDRDGFFGNRAALVAIAVLVALQAAFTYAPPMQRLFGTAALDAAAWLRVGAFALLLFVLVEFEKRLVRAAARRGR